MIVPRQPALESPARPRGLNCAWTVDLEAWFHAHNLAIPPARWDSLPPRLDEPVQRLLALFQRNGVRATFFVLGWLAERLPHLVRSIQAEGHEIASHGYGHRPLSDLNPRSFRRDLRHSRVAIENVVGQAVRGYRAPRYSIPDPRHWALDVLNEEGFRYDSSFYPARAPHGGYGSPGLPLGPHQIRPGLWEFPLPTLGILGWRIPALTGAYLRVLPFWLTRRALAQYAARGLLVVLNVHPWELDPDQPRWPTAWPARGWHYLNLRQTYPRLEQLAGHGSSQTLGELAALPPTDPEDETVAASVRRRGQVTTTRPAIQVVSMPAGIHPPMAQEFEAPSASR